MEEFINFDSSKISWFHCGGKIAVYCKVNSLQELQQVLEKYSRYSNKILPIGAGSNLLIKDEGYDGLAVKLEGDFNKIEIKKDKSLSDKAFLCCGSGLLNKKIVSFALDNNLYGCEFLATIPGTIGGSVKMNSGCFNCEIKQILSSVQILEKNKIKILTNDDLRFSYRESNIPAGSIILNVELELMIGNIKQIEESNQKIINMVQYRKNRQIIGATCGSTFKNPVDINGNKINAWELIDKVGLRGFCIGGAKFSEKHCNFLVNYNNATATDIKNLIDIAKQKVKDRFNIELEEEIKIF